MSARSYNRANGSLLDDELGGIQRAYANLPNIPADPPNDSEPCQVVFGDACQQENSKRHFTDLYSPQRLIARRGWPIMLVLTFDKAVDFQQDEIYVKIKAPVTQKEHYIPVNPKILRPEEISEGLTDESGWGAALVYSDQNIIAIKLISSVKASIGFQLITICTVRRAAETQKESNLTGYSGIYLLFNAYNKDDDAYSPTAEHIQHYMVAKTGKIYLGNHQVKSSMTWWFNQYDDIVLDGTLYLIEQACLFGLQAEQLGDIRLVTKHLTAMINANEDDGLMIGKWDGDYSDGVSPGEWYDTRSIMEAYFQGGPVKYAQCWVFGAVLASCLKSIGVLSRVISCFGSVHDVDGNFAVDVYFGEDMKELEGNRDSIWNFHAWTEAWMSRPDLGGQYGGWQAIDATPQEQFDGRSCVGPASVTGIRYGMVDLPHTARYVYCETNSVIDRWMHIDNQLVYVERGEDELDTAVSLILTQQAAETESVDSPYDGLDITPNYLAPEDVAKRLLEERDNSKLNTRSALQSKSKEPETKEDKLIYKILPIKKTTLGEPLDINIQVKNPLPETKSVNCHVRLTSMNYNGKTANELKYQKFPPKEVAANGEISLVLTLAPSEYVGKLTNDRIIRVAVRGTAADTGHWATVMDTALEGVKPTLTLTRNPKSNTELDFSFQFTNPLNARVTKGVLSLGGDGVSQPVKIPIESVKPRENFEYKGKLTASGAQSSIILATFLSDLLGVMRVSVQVPPM